MRTFRRWVVAVAAAACAWAAPAAGGECPLQKNLDDARAVHQLAVAAANKAPISTALEIKIISLVGPQFLKNPGAGWIDSLKTLQPELTAAEWAELGAYLAADAAYEASGASLQAAQDAYDQERARASAAVKKAEAEYAEEVKFLDAERAAIQSMTIDTPEYLDRAAALADRLKKAYARMNADLAPYAGCFFNAELFVADKNKRLKKIAALEAEIARRRGLKPATMPTDATATVTTAVDPNAPKLGATWRLVGPPEVTKPYGVITSATAARIDFAFRHDDGTDVKGFVTCDKPPPDVIREGQRVDLAATAGGDPKAAASGGFWLEQVAHGGLLPGSWGGCSVIQNFDAGRGDSTRAAVSFYFYPYHSATECVILFGGGRFNGSEAKVTWRYRKE